MQVPRSPSGTSTGSYTALGRPGAASCCTSSRSGASRPAGPERPPDQARHACRSSSIVAVLAHPGGPQLPRRAAEQALGSHRQPGVQPLGADAQGAAGLDAPAKITVFDQAAQFDRFRDRLEEYTYQTKQLTIEYVDIDRQPARASAANVQTAGTMVLDYKGRTERITALEEQDIANALIKATTGQERKVYFTQGHGEKDPASSERDGLQRRRRGTEGRQLRLREAGPGADAGRARRRHGRDRRRPADRLLPRRDRRARRRTWPRAASCS